MSTAKSVIVVGSSGMVGELALRRCLAREDVALVTTLVRRPTGRTHDKLRELVHEDFGDLSNLRSALEGHDAALYCIGVYTGQVPPAEFRRITVDYTVAFAEPLRRGSPDATFCFLSGQGADPTEKSAMMFARDKGAAENALRHLAFRRLHIFRPGYIYPVAPRREPNLTYRLSRLAYPAVRHLYPNIGLTSEALAEALVRAALEDDFVPKGQVVLENRVIRSLSPR